MGISAVDKRLYVLCETIIESQQLEPNLHRDLMLLLDSSDLKDRYLHDVGMREAYNNITEADKILSLACAKHNIVKDIFKLW